MAEIIVCPIVPIGDRVVVHKTKNKKNEKTYKLGGIYLPTPDEKEKFIIVAIGNGDEVKKLQLSIGDAIISDKYTGQEYVETINGENETFIVLKSSDIVAKISN